MSRNTFFVTTREHVEGEEEIPYDSWLKYLLLQDFPQDEFIQPGKFKQWKILFNSVFGVKLTWSWIAFSRNRKTLVIDWN